MAAMAQSMNRYAYAHGNPLRYIDRNGNKIEEPTNDPEAVSNVAEGAGNFLWNLLEPLRQIADVLVADAAANEGIDAKYVKMSSNLGKSSQEAVLAGEDPWDVALNSIHGQIRGYATLGLEQLAEPFSDMAAYYDGRISLPEYNKRMGGHLAGAGLLYVGARAARGGAGRAKPGVLAEKPTALASERLPLQRSAAADAAPKSAPQMRLPSDSANATKLMYDSESGVMGPRSASSGRRVEASFDEGLVRSQAETLREGQFLNRFVRQGEYDAIQAALERGDGSVTLGRYFTQDAIPTLRAAGAELALPNLVKDPIVGMLRVPAPSLRGNAFMGPRLVRPDFNQIGFGTEVEFYSSPTVPTRGLELLRTKQ
jgi:hypothetical protein